MLRLAAPVPQSTARSVVARSLYRLAPRRSCGFDLLRLIAHKQARVCTRARVSACVGACVLSDRTKVVVSATQRSFAARHTRSQHTVCRAWCSRSLTARMMSSEERVSDCEETAHSLARSLASDG